MGRTQRPQSKSSSRSAAKQIAKKSKAVKSMSTAHKGQSQSAFISDADARAVVARGLTVSEAVELMAIYHCGIKQLLRMYKCRKTRLHDAIAKARTYIASVTCRKQNAKQAKPRPHPPSEPSKKKDVVVVWIGDYLDVWDPVKTPKEGDVVSVQTIVKNLEHPSASPIAHVRVSEVYDITCIVKRKKVVKTNVVGVLEGALRVYEHDGPVSSYKMWTAGNHVRFYAEHVGSVETE